MPGIGPAFALMVALLFRLSKAATLLGTFTTNPWTVAPIYVASFRIGERLLGAHERIDWQKLRTFESGWPQELLDMAGPLALGGFILGLAMAVTAYALARWTIARYKQQRIKRLAGR